MTTYRSKGYKPVEADTIDDAAEIFAGRAARKAFGRKGFMRTLRIDSWTDGGRSATFQAFIGYTPRHEPMTTTGWDEWFTVFAK